MQQRLMQRQNEDRNSMTSCHKGGVKIRDTGNNKIVDPFAGLNPFNVVQEQKAATMAHTKSSYETLDLNIENYSREELFKLFGVSNISLTEDVMKECKKLVLKSHPDKCRLDEKYFIFFSKAYNKLKGIYEFQNKMNIKKTADSSEYYDSEQASLLSNVFEAKKDLKDPKNFNSWFNEQFDKHKLEDPNESGYGNWLKSDDDIVFMGNVNKSNMNSEMEKRKKQVQALSVYKGVSDPYSSNLGGSSLMAYDSNYTSGSLFSNDGMGFTDLRQAYAESVIPVTEDDYRKSMKFNNVEEYKRHRDAIDTKPLSKEEAMRQLFNENKQKDEESAALAFYYAKQSEKAKEKQDSFWSGLKQLTNK
jgi:hypothetical protein